MNTTSVATPGRAESHSHRIAKNTLWLFLGETVGRLVRFWIVIYAARVLGAAEYGVFSYALTIAAFATIFADIGISALLTRETSKNPDQEQRLFTIGFVAKTLLVVLVATLLLVSVPLLNEVPGVESLLALIIAMFAFDSFREFAFGVLRAREAMHIEALIKVLMNIFITALGFWALSYDATAYTLTLSYVVGAGIGCVGIFMLLRKNLVACSWSLFNWRDVADMIALAWPIGILQLLGAIMINTDMTMLGWWRSPEELGYYGAAQKIILLLYVLPTLLSSALFPSFSRLAQSSVEHFREVFQKGVSLALGVALPLAVGGAILAPELMSLLFGAEYLPGSTALKILSVTLIFVFPSTIFSNALFAYNKQRTFLWLSGASILLNAVGNALLIPQYGIEGAACATLVANIVSIALMWHLARRAFSSSLRVRVWRFVAAASGMAVVVIVLQSMVLPTLFIIASGALSYALLLLVLREPLFVQGFSIALRRR